MYFLPLLWVWWSPRRSWGSYPLWPVHFVVSGIWFLGKLIRSWRNSSDPEEIMTFVLRLCITSEGSPEAIMIRGWPQISTSEKVPTSLQSSCLLAFWPDELSQIFHLSSQPAFLCFETKHVAQACDIAEYDFELQSFSLHFPSAGWDYRYVPSNLVYAQYWTHPWGLVYTRQTSYKLHPQPPQVTFFQYPHGSLLKLQLKGIQCLLLVSIGTHSGQTHIPIK